MNAIIDNTFSYSLLNEQIRKHSDILNSLVNNFFVLEALLSEMIKTESGVSLRTKPIEIVVLTYKSKEERIMAAIRDWAYDYMVEIEIDRLRDGTIKISTSIDLSIRVERVEK